MDRTNCKILVLDDDAFTRILHATMLANLGFQQVATCASGPEALGTLHDARTAPLVILIDLNMPGMDGVEFVRHLVTHGYTGSLVLVSGEDGRILKSAHALAVAHRLDVLGSFSKPVSPLLLGAALNKAQSCDATAPGAVRKSYGAVELQFGIQHGELINHYQPKLSLSSGQITGVETLVRWRSPMDGLIYPDQFIPEVESYGLIDALTRAVLVQAFSDAATWQAAGLDLSVAINVSMANLTALDFPDFVSEQAGLKGLQPESIVLEVTESQLMRDLRAPLEILTRLRLRRFRLSIDDFGTGHSSLAQLRDLPFDELKIDRSFVLDWPSSWEWQR
ncbi:Response regulator receiver domain-containing protein [Duganella sacchari]|uniref:Response regulator receiver domain-containing protein n=1 Tax=Duganella sacchari TaxID=551987 RepID=A0A1M7KTB0_9BURK|nr:Response regulator receiver domain-containing protein [Duganella sacchari]